MKKLNAFHLKLIVSFIMILDHIPYFISTDTANIFHIISRCVAPVFAYFAVEGVIHTRNLKKYNLRLFGFAGIMLLGNLAINMLVTTLTPNLDYLERGSFYVNNNIFLTLAMGVLILSLYKLFETQKSKQRFLYLAIAILFMAPSILLTEGGIVVIPFMLITYCLRNNSMGKNLGYLLLFLFFGIKAIININQTGVGITLDMVAFNSNMFYVLAFPLLALYNGKRGPKTNFSKYFFYVFYPLHLWIITLIHLFLG